MEHVSTFKLILELKLTGKFYITDNKASSFVQNIYIIPKLEANYKITVNYSGIKNN